MQAIEFEATAHDYIIHIPKTAPNDVPLRVLLLVDETKTAQEQDNFKTLLTKAVEGLDEKDLERKLDFGRELPEWDI